jgi:cation transporter-like permease
MATQVIRSGRRTRVTAALIAFGIAVAIVVLATQMTSIWSKRTPVQPQRLTAPTTVVSFADSPHLPPGCRVKYGCPHRDKSAKP